MRISDWSSDVCSSDLRAARDEGSAALLACHQALGLEEGQRLAHRHARHPELLHQFLEGGQAHVLRPFADTDAPAHQCRELQVRSVQRRVGKECVRTCSSRWSPSHYTTNPHPLQHTPHPPTPPHPTPPHP